MNRIIKRIGSFKFYFMVAVIVAIFLPPFARYQELRYKNSKLESDMLKTKAQIERLTEEKRLLETDINYVEKKAREKIGLVRKGEIVLKEVSVRK